MLSVCVCLREMREHFIFTDRMWDILALVHSLTRALCSCASTHLCSVFFLLCSRFCFIHKSWSRQSWACFFYFGCLISLFTPSPSSDGILYARSHPQLSGGEIVHTGPSPRPVWFSLPANPASDSHRNAASPNFIWSVCKLAAKQNKWKGRLILEEFKGGKCAFNKRYFYCWVLETKALNIRGVRYADVCIELLMLQVSHQTLPQTFWWAKLFGFPPSF